MSVASRSARRALYRDFYDLIPLFSSLTARPTIATRSAPVCARRCISTVPTRRLHVETRPPLHQQQLVSIETQHQDDMHRRELPMACPGCGALKQSVHPRDAGFYSPTRAAVQRYLNPSAARPSEETQTEDELVRNALANVSEDMREQLGLVGMDTRSAPSTNSSEPVVPICDRCHTLIHHHSGISIDHPSLDAITATIAESPHKYNHVYHIIDAADFPMSFIPALTRRLDLGWVRSRNRRAKTQHWSGGKSGEMSFIITRSDLLAPRKEQADALLPQMREILRDALGRHGENVRLGNVRLVSSKRGWWTRDVKKNIWERGGANWLVGKANVGKSNIFEVLYPKGTNDPKPDFQRVREETRKESVQAALRDSADESIGDDLHLNASISESPNAKSAERRRDETAALATPDFYDTDSLLPPPQQQVNYPVMPIISSLPGTTASPIRIPFGQGKGELIDLPGLARQTLDPYVKPEHQLSLVMKSRVAPERIVIKPGSSLVLGGGLVRLTPCTPDTVFMVHAFLPLSAHLTSTVKAKELESGLRDLDIPSVVDESKKGSTHSAGTFKLSTNVTKKHAGPLVRKDDVGLNVSRLPFVVWATDILIEGCGWIEVVAQVRKPRPGDALHSSPTRAASVEILEHSPMQDQALNASWSPMTVEDAPPLADNATAPPSPGQPAWTPQELRADVPAEKFQPSMLTLKNRDAASSARRHPLEMSAAELSRTMPEIEVFSPEGRFIGQRPSLGCWMLGRPLDKKGSAGTRPRKSMKGAKKLEKMRRREREASSA